MKEIKGRNGGTLKVPEKGETANPNGRPKKFTTLMKEQGYKLSEVNDSIQAAVVPPGGNDDASSGGGVTLISR